MPQSDQLPPVSRDRLVAIIKARSVETGRSFTLASGRTSDFYCNLKPTMLDPEGAYLIGALVVEALAADRPDLVGGLELGAVPLATAAAAVGHGRGMPIRAFVVRKQTKEHGTRSLVEGLMRGDTLKGKRVAILEDVTTTGGSSMKAIEAVRGEGAIVVKVLTIVDRQEGAAEAFRAAGIPFAALVTAAELR
ncbi:MAG: orotate phosphoribosyltransferase [Hyphomicrobiaceae bacterium]|nr:orotate phosphoribosyltransferase [Hyphomicrobiaceae bacterium]